jgi:hypothetical protein
LIPDQSGRRYTNSCHDVDRSIERLRLMGLNIMIMIALSDSDAREALSPVSYSRSVDRVHRS